MLIEPFSSGNSPLHRMDPRCKLVLATIFSIATALLTSYTASLASLTAGMLLLLSCRLPAAPLAKRLLLMNLFIAFLWLFLPFTVRGTSLWQAGPFTASAEGIQLATLITLKSNAILMSLIALAGTSTITAAGQALGSLRVPQKLTLLLLFTWRYVHVILDEYRRLITAAKIRGFAAGTNLHTYRTYANLTAMILIKSLDRAERVDRAMRLRGFTGTFHSLSHTPLRPNDAFFAAALSMLMIALAALDATGLIPHAQFLATLFPS